MGEVKMYSGKPRHSPDSLGHDTVEDTYFVYCDKCGGFGITEYRDLLTWLKTALGILIAVLTGAALWFMLDRYDSLVSEITAWSWTKDLMEIVVGLIIITGFLFLGFDLLLTWAIHSSGVKHSCRQCGNTDITTQNVLEYPERDWTVVDEPVDMILRHTREGFDLVPGS